MKQHKLTFLLAVLMSMVGIKASAYDIVVNGIYYEYNNGVSGTTVSVSQNPSKYKGEIVIPESVTFDGHTYIVTGIGYEAFSWCWDLTSVTIPNSVTTIGNRAFYVNFLTSITIPNSVKTIGNGAFYSSDITSLRIPASVESIDVDAFARCDKLYNIIVENGNNIYDSRNNCNAIIETETNKLIVGCKNTVIPNTVETIGTNAFLFCYDLTYITIPSSVTCIEADAFHGCSKLTSVFIPSSVKEIHDGAFESCSKLSSIIVESTNQEYDSRDYCNAIVETKTNTLICGCKNTTIPSTVSSIGKDAFANNDSLKSIVIPSNVKVIGDSAFDNCRNLNSVTICEGVENIELYAFCACTNLTSLVIPSSVKTIGNSAFYNCWKLSSITIGDGVTSVSSSAFDSTPWLNNLPNGMIYIGKVAYKYKGTMPDNTHIEIKEGTMSIQPYLFEDCTGLTSVTFPSSLTTIGSRAFMDCCNLTSVEIPQGVISIGEDTFWGCTSLKSVKIPSSLITIGDCAFLNCKSLTTLDIPLGVTAIGSGAFQSCESLISVTVPSSVTTIGENAFSQCLCLAEVIIPSSVTSIGNGAFASCISLTSITIPNGVTNIKRYTFYGCSNLTDVYCYAEKVPETEDNPFMYLQIDSATLHVPVGSLEAYSTTEPWNSFGTIVEMTPPIIEFADAGVKAVCVANWDVDDDGELSEGEAAAVTDIGKTFKGNKQIVSFDELQYFTGLTSIEDNAFRGCTGLTSIIIPENVTSIGSDAFSGCTSLTSITIPASVTSIGDFALSNCSSLANVYCYAETVPSTSDDTFDGTNIGRATLYVPKASLAIYKAAAPWSSFGAIVPIEGYTTFNINDEMASLNITTEESGCIVNYTHNFNGEWEALYLPFVVDYDAIKADFDLAEIDGVVQNDDNNDGIADITVLSIMGFKGQMTEPNTPFLIRAKKAGNQTISFENVTVYPTVSETLESSSTSIRYEFTGSYNTLSASALSNRYIVQNGELVKGASCLAPCRWYMTATAKRGAHNLPNKIRIMSVEDVITGVSPLGETEEGAAIFNLSGQRLSKMQKGINIVGGKKVLIK